MPALQVKDFPDDLYAKLKECAARNHRSMSQQTVAYVEQGMASEGSSGRVALAGRGACAGSFDTVAERAARIRKRKELFALIDETRVEISPDFPCPAEIVREGRSERERELDERCDSLTFGRAEA